MKPLDYQIVIPANAGIHRARHFLSFPRPLVPAKAGRESMFTFTGQMDSRLRGNEGLA